MDSGKLTSSLAHDLGDAFSLVTPTLAHGELSLSRGLLPETWGLYGVSEILRVVAGAESSASAGYKLQLAGKQSRATTNSAGVTFGGNRILQSAGRG